MEILTFILSILLLFMVCFIGILILSKNAKEFHIHLDIRNGFDISVSFYENQQSQK